MTKPLRFEGQSDDTFGEYGRTMEDYDNCASGKPIVFGVVDRTEAGLLVWGQYGGRDRPEGAPPCWVVGVQQLEEDAPLPDWPMRFETASNGYSPALVIDAPEGVVVRLFSPERAR